MNTAKIIVFVSGNGTNFQTLVDAQNDGFLHANVVGVVSNKSDAHALQRARQNNIPIFVELYDSKNESRSQYETRLAKIVNNLQPDLIVLVGWMHIFTKTFLDQFSNITINLHPALYGEFTGLNAIEQAFNAHKLGKQHHSGVMVHNVIEEIDAGTVVDQVRLNIFPQDTLESFKKRVQYHEKSLLLRSIDKKLVVFYDSQKTVYRGKVRDVYDIDFDRFAMFYTNRLSSFDRQMCQIPRKGKLLNAMCAWWFDKTNHIIPNHLIYHNSNGSIVHKCKRFDIEVVVRGFITGSTNTSLWTHYNNGEREYCGIKFPDGLRKNQRLPEPIITPTTKSEIHDKPITVNDIYEMGLATVEEWEFISRKAMELFKFGQKVADERGLILVDTKYEFGKDVNGNIILIDEIHTLDSSRWWLKSSFEQRFANHDEPEKFDKDIIRDYVKSKCDPYTCEILPEIPKDLIAKMTDVYTDFIQRLTGKPFTDIDNLSYSGEADRLEFAKYYYENIHKNIVIVISGSVRDKQHVEKLQAELKIQKITSLWIVASAHKDTAKVLKLLGKFNRQNKYRNIVYVTVAGRSNALSGVVACNTENIVIACPPFKDKLDMQTNIQSTLQMPSKTPVLTILEPNNVALAIKRMFK